MASKWYGSNRNIYFKSICLTSFLLIFLYMTGNVYYSHIIDWFRPTNSKVNYLDVSPANVGKFSALRSCITNQIMPDSDAKKGRLIYKDMTKTVMRCTSRYLNFDGQPNKLKHFHQSLYNETKVFIEQIDPTQSTTYLTIGIGGDVQAEREFYHQYPTSRLFGIEPSADQVYGYSDFGTVIPYATGLLRETTNITILSGERKWTKASIEIWPLSHLLDEYVHSRLIHFATIDLEGFEYGILDGFRKGKTLDIENVIFCQVDAEFHTLKWKPKQFNFATYIRQLLVESEFVPIYATDYLYHRKLTLANVVNKECDKLFGFSNYLLANPI